jgi:hypothetical protein
MTAFPPKVAAALVAVMSDVKTLGKTNENQHARYKFAGIDDFLEATRPLCAKHGLIIIQDEEDFQVLGDGWLSMRFGFRLGHSSGEMWDGIIRRSIMVQAKMGSQAFGAAQSYVLKQFMRSLFQMATGDGEDADSHDQRELAPARKSASQAKKDGDWDRITAAIDKCETADELDNWLRKMGPYWATMPVAWKEQAENEVLKHKEWLLDRMATA